MTKLRILIIGGGGREHAIAWKLAQSPRIGQLFITPGNPGTAQIGQNVNIPVTEIGNLVTFAREARIDLTVVGPEDPLAAGIVDAFQAVGLKIFGPTQAAAQLEASKVYAKAFMREFNIPTAEYASFSDYYEAKKYLVLNKRPIVVKADGLAAGKGVTVCETPTDAQVALTNMMLEGVFGAAGSKVVLEERLIGREVSVLAFSDGKTLALMPPARDHKRVFDGDLGANTGGMGVIAPVPDVDDALMNEIRTRVLLPTLEGMAQRGLPYVGVLYAGMMLTPDGIRTLEFNCRFGDPETQAILPLLETDLLEILLACVEGRLNQVPVRWRNGACAAVVVASPGYPERYPKGLPITGVAAAEGITGVTVFHAGTGIKDGQLVTSGGRVLAVAGIGVDLDSALKTAYNGVSQLRFEGMHYRRDIGKPLPCKSCARYSAFSASWRFDFSPSNFND